GHGNRARLYARDEAAVDSINRAHQNPAYLPGIDLHADLHASTDPEEVLDRCDLILCVIPAQALAGALAQLKDVLPPSIPVVICAKGIERRSGLLMSEVAGQILPDHDLAALSGPSFASDVARGLPTAVTVAASTMPVADRIAIMLSGPGFRCYSSDDVIGVE